MKRWEEPTRKEYMKEYRSRYDKEYYQINKDKLRIQKAQRRKDLREWFKNEIKGKLKCARCPEDFWACMEFHHEDPSKKEFTLSDMVGGGHSKEAILSEIEKCIVLCSNCHRKEHSESNVGSVV